MLHKVCLFLQVQYIMLQEAVFSHESGKAFFLHALNPKIVFSCRHALYRLAFKGHRTDQSRSTLIGERKESYHNNRITTEEWLITLSRKPLDDSNFDIYDLLRTYEAKFTEYPKLIIYCPNTNPLMFEIAVTFKDLTLDLK